MRCTNDVLMSKITNNKLDKNVELFLTVLDDLPDCKRISADRYVKVVDGEGVEAETAPTFNRFLRPESQFECDKDRCVNTGTLYIGNAANSAIYRLPYDAVEFAAGVITFYVTGFTGDKNATVTIATDSDFTNADVFVIPVTGKANEFTPVVLDLASTTPSSTAGTGWTPSSTGAYLKINVNDANAGISSIAIFDDKDDFEISDTVVIGCITEIGGDEEFEESESTCWKTGYDMSADNTKEIEVTAHSVSSNYPKLNPRYGKGEATTGWKSNNVEKVVEADGEYGKVIIDDMSTEACGFVTAEAECEHLERLSIPTQIPLDENQYNTVTLEDGSTAFYFHKDLVGKTVKISYPQVEENITERVYSDNNIGGVRVKAEQVVTQSNGTKIVRIFDDVIVTGFPGTINEDETEFTFTLSVRRGVNGHRYREYVLSK